MSNNQKAVEIGATSKDPKSTTSSSSNKDSAVGVAELSEEDARIKSEVELLVTRSGDVEQGLVTSACQKMRELLQTARGSAASVPKPLKFIRPHFDTLAANAQKCIETKGDENAKTIYDILSFVSMTRQPTEEREAEEAREKEKDKEKEKDVNQSKNAASLKKKQEDQDKKKKEEQEKKLGADSAPTASIGDSASSSSSSPTASKKNLPFVPMFECIDYKVKGHVGELAPWGYEYVRHIGGDLVKKLKRLVDQQPDDDASVAGPFDLLAKDPNLVSVAKSVVGYLVEHQDEPTACDVAMELGALAFVAPLVDHNNCDRVGPYLVALADYLASERDEIIESVFQMYLRNKRFAAALRVAFMIINSKYGTLSEEESNGQIQRVFDAVGAQQDLPAETARAQKLQLALMCGRFRSSYATPDGDADIDSLVTNEKQSEFFRKVAASLDAKAPKAPAEIFKEHVMDKHLIPQVANSHMHNLATSFVSGFVNAGYGQDTLVGGAAGDSWIFQTKEHRQMSAVGCVGLLHLWDHEEGFNDIMRFNANPDNNIKAGVLLSTGIISSGIRVPFDPAFSVLSESVAEGARELRVASIVGLGLAYAGTNREDIKDLLIPLVVDGSQPVELQCLAAHAIGLVYCGTANGDVCEAVLMCLMDKSEEQLKDPTIRYLILALGLLALRVRDRADGMAEAAKTLPATISKYAEVVILSCAHVATGNVVIVQKLLNIVAEKPKEDDDAAGGAGDEEAKAGAVAGGGGGGGGAEDDANKAAAVAAAAAAAAQQQPKAKDNKAKKEAPLWSHKAAALMGVAMVALGEEVGTSLVKRAIHHVLLSKQEAAISGRRGLPLALALLSVSDPSVPIIDTLSKLSHDSDAPTAQAAIIGMGIAAAGSNNARVATLLRNLSGYYHKDMSMLYIVRLSQGLTHLGKGHITCSPLKFDRTVVSTVCLGGILSFLHTAMDCEKTLLGDYHFMAFSLVPAFSPRFTVLVDDKLEPVKDQQVRIGTPVDTVAVAGRPKTITGFQTQLSPVLLQEGERIEIVPGKNQVVCVGTLLEGVVVVAPRKDSEADDEQQISTKKVASPNSKSSAVTADG